MDTAIESQDQVEDEANDPEEQDNKFLEQFQLMEDVRYNKDIKPIIKKHCIFCHNGLVLARKNLGRYDVAKRYGELMLIYMEGKGEIVMPPSGPLPDEIVNVVRTWVQTGKKR